MRNNYADNVLENVVELLAEARKAKGVSHETLAQKAGVTRPAISHIESGKRKPSLLICLKLAHALDLKLWTLIKKAEK
jgi:DNA-binding XRE family transcriptional regulator